MSKSITDQDIYTLHQIIQQLEFLTTVHLAAQDYRVNSEAIAATFDGLKAPLLHMQRRWSMPDTPAQMHAPDTSTPLDAQG